MSGSGQVVTERVSGVEMINGKLRRERMVGCGLTRSWAWAGMGGHAVAGASIC